MTLPLHKSKSGVQICTPERIGVVKRVGDGVRADVGVREFEAGGAMHPTSSKAVTVTARTAISIAFACLFIGLTNPPSKML